MRKTCLFALLFIASTLMAAPPESAIHAYINAVKKDGLANAAKLFHPDELAKFRQMLAPVIIEALKEGDGRAVFGRFSSPADKTEMRDVTDESFMSLFLMCIEAIQPELSSALKTATVETLGHIVEGEIKHVVTRTKVSVEGVTVEQMGVMSVRDFKEEPMMLLTGEIRQLATALRRQK